MKTKELKAEISNLPIDQRAKMADYILQTLNQPDPEIEEAWKTEVQCRKKQVETGEVALIPGDQFDREVQEMKKSFSE